MSSHLSNTNLTILAIGLLLVLLNIVGSSRLAPPIAGFFARLGREWRIESLMARAFAYADGREAEQATTVLAPRAPLVKLKFFI